MKDLSKSPLPKYEKPWAELVKLPSGSLLNPNTQGAQGASLPGVTVPVAEVAPANENPQAEAFNALSQASVPQEAPVTEIPSVTPEVTE
jgi:hypothetical protein